MSQTFLFRAIFCISIVHAICVQSAQEPHVTFYTQKNDSFSVPFAKIKDWGKYKDMVEEGVDVATSYIEEIGIGETYTSVKDFFVLTKVLPPQPLHNAQLNFTSLALPCAMEYLEINKDKKLFDELMVTCAQSYLSTFEEEESLASKVWRFMLRQPYVPRYNWLGIVPIIMHNVSKKFASEVKIAPFGIYFAEQALAANSMHVVQMPHSLSQRFFVTTCTLMARLIEGCKKQLNMTVQKPLHENVVMNELIAPDDKTKISFYDICEHEYYLRKLNKDTYEDTFCRIYNSLQPIQSEHSPERYEDEDVYAYIFRTCTVPAKIEFYVKQLINLLHNDTITSVKTRPTLECIHALERYGYLIRHKGQLTYETNPPWYDLYLLWIPKNDPLRKKNILTIQTSEEIYGGYKSYGPRRMIPQKGDAGYKRNKHEIPLITYLLKLPTKDSFLQQYHAESPPFMITLPKDRW